MGILACRNPIYFYSVDRERQQIPYVVVTDPDGSKTEYIDVESGFDPASIKQEDLENGLYLSSKCRAASKTRNRQQPHQPRADLSKFLFRKNALSTQQSIRGRI